MTCSQHDPTCKRHRFPRENIANAVWLYFNFTLSYHDVETMLAERGIVVSHKAIRSWCRKFGHAYTRRLRGKRPRTGDTRYSDIMQRFKVGGSAQRFLSVFEIMYKHFHIKHRLMTASDFRHERSKCFVTWHQITADLVA